MKEIKCAKCGHNVKDESKFCPTCGNNLTKDGAKQIIDLKEEKDGKSTTFNIIEVVIVVLITAIVSATSTGIVVYKNSNKMGGLSLKDGNYFGELERIYKELVGTYYKNIDEKELVNSAIEGMYDYLEDPYSEYLDEEMTSDLMDRLEGEYYGIGVEITQVDNQIIVVTVFDDTPASKAGLKVNDVFVSINGIDVSNKTADEVSSMIKNNDTGKIELTVKRNEETINLTVKREKVSIPSVTYENYDGIGYIYIETFSNTTYNQFKEALEHLEKDGIDKLLIDVRNNGGGYLNSAVDIVELFTEKGKPVYGLERTNGVTFYNDSTKEKRNYEVSVLINGNSASASEILAAALQESYNAKLLGTTSYGKGTVQETQDLESGGMVKYTTAYWLTPKGINIHGVGLTPDYKIEGDYYVDMPLEEDTQLQQALEYMK